MTTTFIMMVGIPGSGKSTYVNKTLKNEYENLVVVNTDDIREDICGDASCQDKNTAVWGIAKNMIITSLKENKNVVLDATNVSYKDRNKTLSYIPKNVKKVCKVILCSIDEIFERNESRDRVVPKDVIIRMLSRFSMPTEKEGWDKIEYINLSDHLMTYEDYMKLSINFDQTSNWHQETLDRHINNVYEYIKFTFVVSHRTERLMEVAKWHDFGKLYVRTYDENGNAHFYGHANVSCFIYLAAQKEYTEEILYRALLILYHDNSYQMTEEQCIKKYGYWMTGELFDFHTADEAGSIRKE